jgi:RimJ/RimL family protein N-acetyltransferase
VKVDLDLILAPLDSTDVELVREWRNDYRIWRWCRQSDVISDVEQRAWFERQASDPAVKTWKLVRKTDSDAKTVGVCGLSGIDWLSRRAEFSLFIAPRYQRRGYARAGLTIMLEHAFKNLGLHQISGEVFDGNPALSLFFSLGMRHDGTRRQFYFRDGKFIDCHLVSILAEEWHARSSPSGPDDSDPDVRDRVPGDRLPEALPDVHAGPEDLPKIKRAASRSLTRAPGKA